jgi:hypothetical protein
MLTIAVLTLYAATVVTVLAALPVALYVLGLLAYDEVAELFAQQARNRLHTGVSGLTITHVSTAQRPPGAATTTT